MRRYGQLRLYVRTASRARKLIIASTPIVVALIGFAHHYLKEQNQRRQIEQEAQEQAITMMMQTMGELRTELNRCHARTADLRQRLTEQDERIRALEAKADESRREAIRLKSLLQEHAQEIARQRSLRRGDAIDRARARPPEPVPTEEGSTLY